MGRLIDYFKSVFMPNVQEQIVSNHAVGIQCRGDLIGGNLNINDIRNIADGSYIGGDLKIKSSETNEDQLLKKLSNMDLRVGGRIIVNGTDITDKYNALRK